MALLSSQPQRPLPWGRLVATMGGLWLAPVPLGAATLLLSQPIAMIAKSPPFDSAALVLGFLGYALIASPLLAWIGWLLALLPVALALERGWFGWGSALLIGAGAGQAAGALGEIELALPFGMVALLALRATLGRLLPL